MDKFLVLRFFEGFEVFFRVEKKKVSFFSSAEKSTEENREKKKTPSSPPPTPQPLFTHLDVLVLVLLVVLEEPPDLVEPVLGQLGDVLKVAVLGVVGVDGDDLVVALALVDHLHHADGLGAQEGHGDDGLLG